MPEKKKRGRPSNKTATPPLELGKPFTLCVSYNDQKHVIDTDNVIEALLSIHPQKITTKTIISLEHEGRKSEKWIYPSKARYVFNNKLTAEIFARRLQLSLK